MSVTFAMTGVKELDDALSYLRDKSAKRIGKAASRKMASVLARGMRTFVPKSLAKSLMMTTTKGIGSRGDKARQSNIQVAKAGVAVGAAGRAAKFSVMNRGKRRGVGVGARNLHWFAAGTTDRYTGTRTYRVKGGKRTKSTGNARHFTGRINKQIWGGFVQRGATAMRTTAIAEAAKLMNKMIVAEAQAARTGGEPVLVELGIDT